MARSSLPAKVEGHILCEDNKTFVHSGARRLWLRVRRRRTNCLHADRLYGPDHRSDRCAGSEARNGRCDRTGWVNEKHHLHLGNGHLPSVLPRFHTRQRHYSACSWHPDHRSDQTADVRSHPTEWSGVPSGMSKRSSDGGAVKSPPAGGRRLSPHTGRGLPLLSAKGDGRIDV
jgi:hypothetical protein